MGTPLPLRGRDAPTPGEPKNLPLKSLQPAYTKVKFEVGNVYLRNRPRTLCLAVPSRTEVGETVLVFWKDGDLHELRPATKKGIHAQRDTSISELCDTWGVDVCVIDAITKLYIQPTKSRDLNPKQKRKGRQKGTAEEELDRQKLILRRRFHNG